MRALLAAVAVLSLAGPARAVEAGDRAAIEGAIGGQIEAFRRDDAVAAYGYAAPGIRGIFPDETVFMDMVRQGYRPVYRPRSFDFGALEDLPDGGAKQSVMVKDADGVDWQALYTLERGPDGTWKITGCTLVRAPGANA